MKLHSVLQHQLEKLKLEVDETPNLNQWNSFLQSLGESYKSLEHDRSLVERALDISNREMQARWEHLQTVERIISEQREQISRHRELSTLGKMAGGIAHEINTPLSIFALYADLLLDAVAAPEVDRALVREAAEKIQETTNRISEVIEGLKTFSNSAKLQPKQITNLHALVHETLEGCRPRFSEAGVQIEVGEMDDQWTLDCRSGELSQVFLNLLINAGEAAVHQTEKWIKVECRREPGYYEFSVTDSGQGIPFEIREKMFEPFFTTKKVGKGTGMGLSLSKGIVESHQGELTLDTSCSHTKFIVRLPIGEEA